MNEHERIRRAPPGRAAPLRNDWPGAPAGRNDWPGAPADHQPPPDAGLEKVIAHTVRLGYEVIGENIRQGRLAADRFSAGDYGVRDVPRDLLALSSRMLQLSRDISTTAFDICGAILRDPTLRAAVQRYAAPPNPAPASAPAGGPWPGQGAAGVPLTYAFKGTRRAVGMPGWLRGTGQPSLLSTAGLWSPDPALPPLRQVALSADAFAIIATVTIPDDQPAGTYSGVVSDALTHQPLGAMTVQVEA